MTSPAVPDVRTGRTSLDLPDTLDFDQWLAIGRQVIAAAEASNWWVGDWIVWAEDHLAGDGDTATQAKVRQAIADLSTLDPIQLANASKVARRYPPGARRRTLSWNHHARLVDAQGELVEQLLDAAETEGWTEAQLAQERRKWEATEVKEVEAPAAKVRAAIRVTAPAEAEDELRSVLEEEVERIRARLADVGADVALR